MCFCFAGFRYFVFHLIWVFVVKSYLFGLRENFRCNVIHLVGSFNAAEAILLGFQHYLVMLGTTVIIPTILVPQMGGGNVSLNHRICTTYEVVGSFWPFVLKKFGCFCCLRMRKLG